MKIAIVGSAPSSRLIAPYEDSSWEIWTGTPANAEQPLPRVNTWFELHTLWFLLSPRQQTWSLKYLDYLKNLKCPVYMQELNKYVPNAQVFPKDAIVTEFGHNLFTSSAAWMLAKAIYDKAEQIGLYGLDMTAGSEYHYERPACQYLIHEARKRGIKVSIPPQSDLDVQVPLYGYDDNNHISIKMTEHAFELRNRISDLEKQLQHVDVQKSKLLMNKAYLEGALEQNTNTRRTWHAWSGPDKEPV